jgi:tetratricopeptide (TPR) repeat protein
MEPRAIAHFDVLGRLGSGGMGVVYRARDRVLGRVVALKLVRPEEAGDVQARQRLLREARAAAVLSHPGIATVYEAGEAPAGEGGASQLFIAQELVPGEPLSRRVRRGPLSVAEAEALGLELAEALAEAHAHGIVHRDVKPANLMVTPGGHLKVLDFGLARWRTPAADLPASEADGETWTWSQTAPGHAGGTPGYMAPEQIAGDPVAAAADVYAAGCVVYEMLSGRPPHVGASSAEVLRRTLTEPARPLAELRPDVPPAVAAVVARALSREPSERPADGRALAEALREAAARRAREAGARKGRFRLARPAATAVLLAAAAGIAAWLVLGRAARPALAFRERDFVLVADVLNGTGEPVFDLALRSGIETDLRQSRYVNVFDSAQVQNTLRMMRLGPETRLDANVGRDLCRRAGVRALVVPRILRIGEAYQVAATLVEPSTGRVVAEAEASAGSREQVLLTAIDRLTRDLRERLGESIDSIARSDPPFTQYTTSSLEALELLAVAARAAGRGEFPKAERSYAEALSHDPKFPAARASRGLLLIQFLGRAAEGKAELARALVDSDDVSKREHLHIRALNRQFVAADLPGALEDYRFIAELYPDMMQPYNNSARILEALGRLREASEMYDRAHEKDPRALVPLWNAYFLRSGRLPDPAGTERAARALVALQPDLANAAHTLGWAFVMQRRFAEAEQQMRATLRLDPENPYALPNLAHLLLRRGAAEEAVAIYRRLGEVGEEARRQMNADHDALCLGLALRAAGKEAEAASVMGAAARAMLARTGRRPADAVAEATRATLLAGSGRTAEARRILARVERAGEATAEAAAWLARAHALLEDVDRAAVLFERAVTTGYRDPYYVLVDPPLAAIRDRPEIDRLIPAGSPAG